MATSGEMTRLFSDALGLTEAHVAARYRALRESGLVTKGGRGRFAPTMSPLDAARLLIAVMAAQTISETEASVKIFGRSDCHLDEDDNPFGIAIQNLVFEDAVALVLQGCLAGRLGDEATYSRWAEGVTIEVSPSDLTASIERKGFRALFMPDAFKDFASEVRMSDEMTPADRMRLRADRPGLDIRISVHTTDLLELAPALGPADGIYRPTH